MALLMSVAKQTVLGTRRAITRPDCWNKMSASRAVLYLKMDHSAVGKDIIHINTVSWWGVSFDVLGHLCFFHTELLYVAHSFETSANLLGEGQTGHRYPSRFLISQYLFDSSIFIENSAVKQNICDHQCSLQFVQECVRKPGIFPIQCLIKW